MRKRHHNPRLAKIHYSYTVEGIVDLYSVHKNTVLNWIKKGLPVIDNKRPMLVHGLELRSFLEMRRTRNKCKCKPGELYCVKCRLPKPPAENIAYYLPVTEKGGNLNAICPDCDCIMNRRVSLAKIREVCGNIDISFPEDMRHIVESDKPSVNSDLRQGETNHEKVQSE